MDESRTVSSFPHEASPGLRRIVVFALAVLAVAASPLFMALGWDRPQTAFAADGDRAIRAAGFAFAIWAIIYLGLIGYGLAQVIRKDAPPVLRRIGWPSAWALLGIVAWLGVAQTPGPATAFTLAGTAAVITASALVLIRALWASGPDQDGATAWERALFVWPLALLAGWLTVASVLNLVISLTASGNLTPASDALVGALAPAAALILGSVVLWRTRLVLYALPIMWGLFGVWSAERLRHPETARFALGALIVLGLLTLARGRR